MNDNVLFGESYRELIKEMESANPAGYVISITSVESLKWFVKEYGVEIVNSNYRRGRLQISDNVTRKYYQENYSTK